MLLTTVLTSVLHFEAATSTFPASDKYLRQWDSPTVADLDQDGWPDLLLNDHGFSIRVMWNNKGQFSKPYDLIMGDVHGIAVADYDNDGLNEIVLSRGGGSGSNARNSLIMQVDKTRKFSREPDFATPLALMRGRTVKFADLDNDGDLDLINFAFPSKEKLGSSENYLYENLPSGSKTELTLRATLPASHGDGQKTLLTDINNDSLPDMVMYGHKDVSVYLNQGNFEFKNVSNDVLPSNITDVTNVIDIDVDNDGDLDLMFTRGKGFKSGDVFFDAKTNRAGFYNLRKTAKLPLMTAGDVVELYNFQSQWPHKSLYLGESAYEYQYPGETHSGRHIRLVNSDVLGFPEQTNKKGLYLGYVGNQQWQLVSNTWSPMSAVIKGIKKVDAPTSDLLPEPGLLDVLLINHKGKFTVAAKDSFPVISEHSQAAVAVDIDQNGWQDIVVINRGHLINDNKSSIYLNSGKGNFKLVTEHNLITRDLGSVGMGIGKVDYDLDGRDDLIIGNERGKWHLFNNKNATNNFVTIKLEGRSQIPYHSKVTVNACGQRQVLRAYDSAPQYSQSVTSVFNFGIGDCHKSVNAEVSFGNDKPIKRTLKPNTHITISIEE